MKLAILAFVAFCSCLSLATNIPAQVHVALAGQDANGNSNRLAVSWNTVNQTPTSTVKYGIVSGQYTEVATGSSSAYYETFNHHVVLNALAPATSYFYIVGDDVEGWSKEFTVKSAPTSDLRENWSFLIYGDLGVINGDPTKDYINAHKDGLELIWHAGDAGYADDSFLHKGCVTKFCYEETYDEYMVNIEPWASKIPYMVTPGNHEADCHDPACLTDRTRREKLSNFTAYNHRFRMPSPESGGVLNMHYSFNYGNVHFISIDAETGFPGAAEETKYVLPCGGFGDQLAWLEADLIQANADRSVRPWIFAAGHHPMYQGSSIDKNFQAAMEELFYKYGVDVYFAGHVHQYERNLPVYQGIPEKDYVDPVATTHLLIGGAGNDEMHHIKLDRSQDPSPQGPKDNDEMGPWTVVMDMDDHVGIGKVTVVNDSTMTFEYIRTMTGEVFDSMTLTRDHSRYGAKKSV